MNEFVLAPARRGPFRGHLAPDAIAAYAAVTGDCTATMLDGRAVPAVFPVLLVFEAQEAARADLPAAVWESVRGGVHGEHDIVLHRPLVADEPLDTWAQISALRTTGGHLCRRAPRTVRRRRHHRCRTVVDHGAARSDRRSRSRVDAGRASHSRRSAGQSAGVDRPTHRRADGSSVRRIVRRLVGPPLRHRGRPRGRIRLRVRSRTVHDGNLHPSRARVGRRRRSRQGGAGGCAVRVADTAGGRTHRRRLWHRRTTFRVRGERTRRHHHQPRKIGTEAMTKPEIGVYLPQMGFTYDQILHRALRCEELGIDSLWLYDHLYAPGTPDYPSLEAWTLATALLSRTERIQVGHMVLCNQFRHPAVLAKMATTLDQISAGRLQLGIGSGSIEDEHARVGLHWGTFAERSERLGETLQILHQ